MSKYTSAVATGLARRIPGKASNFVLPWEFVHCGLRLVIYARVSGREQRRRGNLQDQCSGLRAAATAVGAKVVDVVAVEERGGDYDGEGLCPIGLIRAIAIARKQSAMVLAESVDRYIRHPDFSAKDSQRRMYRARDTDLRDIHYWADGVELISLVPPDATLQEVERHRQARGKRFSSRKDGRPKKKRPGHKREWRKQKEPLVLELHERAITLKDIVARTGVSYGSVWRWTHGK